MEYSNLFGTSTSSGGGSTNLSNYYNKQEVDAIAVQKANLSAGKLASGEVPDLAITNVVTVLNNTARDALTVEAGDVAIVSSTGLTYMYTGSAWTQIESTQVSWDNVLSSSSQTATAKFAAVDTALGNALTPLGSTGDYKVPMYNSSATTWTDFPQLSNTGSAGQSIIAWDGVGTANGGQIQAGRQSAHYGSSASNYQGRYMVKKVAGDGIIDVVTETQNANESQLLRVKLVGTSSDDGQYLKWNNSSGTASWQAVTSGSGPTLPSISAGQSNEILRVNGNGTDLETFALTLSDAGTTSGQVSLKATGHSKSDHSIKTLKAGTNISLSTVSDSNCIEISSTASGGGGGGPTINDSQTTSTTEVWSSDYTAQQVAGRAALSHTHVIGDVTNLQGALDAKVDDSQVKTSNSTSNTDVYACSYLNDTKNIFGSGSLTNQLLGWNGNGWGAQSVGSAGTYLRSDGTSGLTYYQLINDSGNGSATECYSSQKMYADLQNKAPASHNHDSVYIKIADRKSAQSSTSTDVYDVGFLNTALGARMSSTVTDMASSGTSLYQVSGNTLGLKRLAAGSNVTLSESGGVITIASSGSGGGGSSDGVVTGGSVSGTTLTLTRSSGGDVTITGLPSGGSSDGVVTGGSVSGTTLTLTRSSGGDVTITGLPSGGSSDGVVTGGSVSGTTLTLTRSSGGDVTITGLPSGGSADGVVDDVTLLSTGELQIRTANGGSTTVYSETISTDKIHWKVFANTAAMPTAGSANHGMVVHNHAEGAMYYSHNNGWVKLGKATDVATNTTNIAAAQTTISGHTTSITANTNAIAGHTTSITANTNAIAPLTAKTTDITYGSSTTSVANTLAPNKMHFQTNSQTVALAAWGDLWGSVPSSGTKTLNFKGDLKIYNALFNIYHRTEFGDLGAIAQQQIHLLSNYNNNANSVPFRQDYHKSGRANAITLQVNQSSNNDATDLFQYEVSSIDEGSLLKVGKQASGDSEVEVVGQVKVSSVKFPDNTVQTSALPAQTGSALHTHVLRTNGTAAAWEPFKAVQQTWTANSNRNANGNLLTVFGDQGVVADTGYDAYIHMVSPKNSANVGRIDSYAQNSASDSTAFSAIETNVHSNTSTATYGSMTLYASQAGANTEDLTAVMRVGKTSASDSAAQINGELRLTAPLKFNDSTTQASAVTVPATAGHVLTAGAGGSWAWAAAAGGSPTYTTTALPSYTSNATGPTNAGLIGVGQGDRRMMWSMWADDQFIKDQGGSNQQTLTLLINGNRSDNSWRNYGAIVGSSWYYKSNENKRYPFTKVTFLDVNAGSFSYDIRFCVGASNDGNEWTWFKSGSFATSQTFTGPFSTSGSSLVKYDGSTYSTYGYTPNTPTGTTGGGYAGTLSWTNTTGYLMYRIMWIGNGTTGGGYPSTDLGVDYYKLTCAEVEWG